jgi:alpha-amylase
MHHCSTTATATVIVAIAAVLVAVVVAEKPPLPGCETFQENRCQGTQTETPESFESHRWYTPLRGDADYRPSFQDYGKLVASAHVVYNAAHTGATVDLHVRTRDPAAVLSYWFDGRASTSPVAAFDTAFTRPLALAVSTAAGERVELDPVDFVWNAAPLAARDGDFRGGQKGAIVELFGWPHADVEKECPTLAKLGYLGVKVFPPNEHVMSSQPFSDALNPWYFFYQPVSYRLQGRMGTRDELRRMINACRKVGVRVYADAVVNHMVGCGNDANPNHRNGAGGGGCTYWPNKNSSMVGGPSPAYTQCYAYTYGTHTDQPPSQEFPAVPYGPTDFHCERALNSWTDPLILNAGWLSGLVDINTGKESVQERIADYLTDLIGIGFSGFRIDAAKHIHPDDLVQIFSKVKRNLGGGPLPGDFIAWLEVLLGGEADLLMCNPASGYNFGKYLADRLETVGKLTLDDVLKVKVWNCGYPKETDKGLCFIDPVRSVI